MCSTRLEAEKVVQPTPENPSQTDDWSGWMIETVAIRQHLETLKSAEVRFDGFYEFSRTQDDTPGTTLPSDR